MNTIAEQQLGLIMEIAELNGYLRDIYETGGELVATVGAYMAINVSIPRAAIESEIKKRLELLQFNFCKAAENNDKIIF